MKKTTTVQFETTDKQVFTDKTAAINHQATLDLQSMGVDSAVALSMVQDYKKYQEILRDVARAARPSKKDKKEKAKDNKKNAKSVAPADALAI